MTDKSFIPYFITEPVYYIPEPEEQVNSSLDEGIIEAEPIQIQAKKEEINIKSRGGFKKRILLLVDDTHPEVINISDAEFLLKILKAVQLSEEDVAIVNVNNLPGNFFTIIDEKFDYRILIMFGIINTEITDRFTKYKITSEEDKKILFADKLSDINDDKQKKLKLWENLQLLFIMK